MQGAASVHNSNKCFKTLPHMHSMEQREGNNIEKPYACKVLKNTFADLRNLRCHERIHTKERPFVCQICEKTFSQIGHVKRHERIHTGEKPYACKICQRAFSDLSHFKVHERIHSGERPYVCKICKKAFSEFGSLRTHEIIHTGERPFVCKICQRAFSNKNSLRRHERRIHSDENPYKRKAVFCKICMKKFRRKDYLKAHERIHTGEKPYICKICTKAFQQISALKYHERIHSRSGSYICCVCSKAFSRREHLLKHQRTHCEKLRQNHRIYKKLSSELHLKSIATNTKERSADMSTARVFMERRPMNSPFAVKPFGCGFCGEMFVEEDHFLMHCSYHSNEGYFLSDLTFHFPCQRTVFSEVLKERSSISDRRKQIGKEAVTGSRLRWFGSFERRPHI